MKTFSFKAVSSTKDNYQVTIEITDKIVTSCNCGAGIFGKICKHKIAILSGDESILFDPNEKSILSELNIIIKNSDFQLFLNELESAKEAVKIAKERENKIKSKLEVALKKGIKINF